MTRLAVRVVPNASRSQVAGWHDGAWKIRLAAPPVDGKANEALIRFLADVLDLAPRDIVLVRGQASKTKWLDIPLSDADMRDALQCQSVG